MKAFAWRRAMAFAALPAALSLSLTGAIASTPAPGPFGLPEGLPALPALSPTMQSDMRTAIGLRGFDPVAYRVQNRAVAGQPAHELLHAGVVWRFASAANLAAFRDAPEAYLPAFAGFDPTGVATGSAVDTDPREFAIIGSRLFLFRSAETRLSFLQDGALLGLAENAWPAVQRALAH